ncbi:MAG: glycoside hydrolase family 65 protein, partial [Bacteroidia bacterium]|nr:glycoside hydrolase family 65 protein [Bacteroidia bacterium]
MNLPLKSLLSSAEWIVEEKEFDKHKLNTYETIFTIGNGYLGTRGSLEEGHSAGLPGTYLNGVFDHFDSFIIDLVNAPDWSELSIWVEGEKLSMENCQVLDYYRALDMKQGLLYRNTRFKDKNGRITNFESVRYANFNNRNQFEVKAVVTPENYSGKITVEAPTNGRVFNLDLEPAYKEKPKFIPEVQWEKWTKSKHLRYVDSGNLDNGIFLELSTMERPYHIMYASHLGIAGASANVSNRFDYESIAQHAEINATEGTAYTINKVTTIFTSRDVKKKALKEAAVSLLQESLKLSFEGRLREHCNIWKTKWDDCDIVIEGDDKANHALRFNIYHLLICANEQDHKANVGAKSLSGEGYKGHVFWDTEIFLLPFYIFTQPETAKALIMYRYHTMQDAKVYAKENGCEGARFAWESTDTGLEATPPWTADGRHRIWTGEREIHITSAVVFGVLTYFQYSQDEDFFVQYGIEILFETARFWNSRLEFNQEKDRYELTEVEGPDEFHELVDNSVYTNWLTKWNLEEAIHYYYELSKTHPDRLNAVVSKLGIHDAEVEEWNHKAEKIYIPFDEEKKLVEEFEGYFGLKDVPISVWDENSMPVYPEGYDHFNCDETTLIKQPDVLMLMYMLPDAFSQEVKKVNYDFYEERTMHKSSLSPSIHTIMGIETGNYDRAFQYFERSAFVDLVDNQGNT